jgi:hypothetical protein
LTEDYDLIVQRSIFKSLGAIVELKLLNKYREREVAVTLMPFLYHPDPTLRNGIYWV